MIKALVVFGVAFALGGCALGGGSTTPAVITNNTVAQKFAAFNKGGWQVTGGIPVAPAAGPQNAVYYRNNQPFNPFARATYTSNLTPTRPAGGSFVGPSTDTGSIPLLGGFVLPRLGPTQANVVGQPSTSNAVVMPR